MVGELNGKTILEQVMADTPRIKTVIFILLHILVSVPLSLRLKPRIISMETNS